MELDGFGCAALPANMQSQPLWFRALDDGDIPDQQAEHALAVTRCGGWSGPESREVSGELQDLPFLFGCDGTQCLPLEVGQLGLQFEQPLHREDLVRHATLQSHIWTSICLDESITSVDRAIVDAARGMGLTDWQLLYKVELPLAASVILAGIRVALVISIGLATIAAAIGAGGLGELIFRGLAMVNNAVILAGAIPAALMALIADTLLGWLEKRFSPQRTA